MRRPYYISLLHDCETSIFAKRVSSSTWHSPLHVRQRGQTGVGVGAAIRLVAVLLCQQQTFQKRLKVLLLPHPRQLCCIAVAAAVSRLVLV